MKSLKIPVRSVLPVLLTSLIFSTVSAFERSYTTVRLHEAATLQCSERCSGLVKWTVFHKQKDILGWCDQTSCQSQEGYQMSHDEYLKGNLSLTITDADFSKRTWYTCQCDGEHICDVSLRLESFSYTVQVHVGKPLFLDLPILDYVEVTFNRSDDAVPNTLRLCKVEGCKAQFESSYEKRVSINSSLQLKEVKKHDEGLYIIQDVKNEEVIGSFNVTVKGSSRVSTIKRTFTIVKLHEAATLQCSERCSGLVKWTVFRKQDVLAQCDQTSCQSQEGYQMSHDEYLKGNLSLTITDADYSKRAWYTCQCNGEAICDVTLQLKPFSYPVHVQVGEPLSLDLPILDDVEVTFNRADDSSPTVLSLCKVVACKPQCDSAYEKRVSVRSSLQLRDVNSHDGGVYIIRDIDNDEVIGKYTVVINGTNTEKMDNRALGDAQADQDGSSVPLLAGLFGGFLVLVGIVGLVVLIVKYQWLQKCRQRIKNTPIRMQKVQQEITD